MNEDTQIELKSRIEETLKEVLLEVQKYAAHSSMAHRDPEKWLYLAGQLSQGRARTNLVRAGEGTHDGLRTIEAQLASSPVIGDLKKELGVQKVKNLQVSHEIRTRLNEVLLKRTDEADTMDMLDLGKLIKELSVADKVDAGDLLRLIGDNTQRIEVTHKTESFDDLLEKAREAREKMKPAEVIDLDEEAEDSE